MNIDEIVNNLINSCQLVAIQTDRTVKIKVKGIEFLFVPKTYWDDKPATCDIYVKNIMDKTEGCRELLRLLLKGA